MMHQVIMITSVCVCVCACVSTCVCVCVLYLTVYTEMGVVTEVSKSSMIVYIYYSSIIVNTIQNIQWSFSIWETTNMKGFAQGK